VTGIVRDGWRKDATSIGRNARISSARVPEAVPMPPRGMVGPPEKAVNECGTGD